MRWFVYAVGFDTITPLIPVSNVRSGGRCWYHCTNDRFQSWWVKPLEYFQHGSLSLCHFVIRTWCKSGGSSKRIVVGPRILVPTVTHSIIVPICTLNGLDKFRFRKVTAHIEIWWRSGRWKFVQNKFYWYVTCKILVFIDKWDNISNGKHQFSFIWYTYLW